MKFLRLNISLIVTVAILSTACKTHYNVDHIDSVSVEMYDSVMLDSAMLLIIDEYKSSLDSSMDLIVGYSEIPIQKGQPESLLGNFVCDLVLEKCIDAYADSLNLVNKSMVLMNNGGFRSSLPKGAITVGDVYRLMPFDNEIVILKMPGSLMKGVFSTIALYGGMPIAGPEIILKADEYTSVSFGGTPFDENDTYFIITSDYIANGGDKIPGLDQNLMYLHTRVLIRDAIIDYFKMLSNSARTANPKLDGRISYE